MFTEDFLVGLLRAKHIVVFTGAGMSAESGIPTFRDAQTGLWEQYSAEKLASPSGFLADKSLVWGWYEWRRMQALQAAPNAGHLAITELAKHVEHLTVITQNVDDLHERAGSRRIIHLHGSLHSPRCFDCANPYTYPDGIPSEPPGGRRLDPPDCNKCGGSIRPGVVWFGEHLPYEEWDKAEKAATECDLFFAIGTSALVRPASQLPERAALHGAKIVQINPNPTPLDDQAHYNFNGAVGEVMPAMVNAFAGFLDTFI
jgi:NAD-dependent deacetylase